jgi:putative DNA primase/helicase
VGHDDLRLAFAVGEFKVKDNAHWKVGQISWAKFCDIPPVESPNKHQVLSYVFGQIDKDQARCGCKTPGLHRNAATVLGRSAVTLDADFLMQDGDPDGDRMRQKIIDLGVEAFVYSTHSSTEGAARLRMVFPTPRMVEQPEYGHIVRLLATQLGWDGTTTKVDGITRWGSFDAGSAQYERFMYVQAAPDASAVYRERFDGDLLDVDFLLDLPDPLPPSERPDIVRAGAGTTASPWEVQEAHKRLEAVAEVVAGTEEGDRNNKLWGQSRSLFGYAFGGCVEEEVVWQRLTEAGLAAGMDEDEVIGTISKAHTKAMGDTPVRPEPVFDLVMDLSCYWDGCDLPPVAGGLRCAVHEEMRNAGWNQAVYEEAEEILGDEEMAEDIAEALTGQVTRWLGVRSATVRQWRTDSDEVDALADKLLAMKWTAPGPSGEEQTLVLQYWHDTLYEWHTTHYAPVPSGHLAGEVNRLLEKGLVARRDRNGAFVEDENGNKRYKKISVNPKQIASVVQMIQLKTLLHAALKGGHWLDTTNGRCPSGPTGRRYLSFKNTLLDLETMEQLSHEPSYFNTFSMRFDYEPEAKCPAWEKTKEAWFPGDRVSQDTLEEIMGYLLLGGMEMQKIFVLLGKARAGKGTVMRLVEHMLGGAFAAQGLDELADRFGKEPLIGKKVVHITEAVNAGPEGRKVVSIMKSISGEDTGASIMRKGKENAQVALECRFVLSGNEDVTLPDSSGVIIDRVVALDFQQSFLGREDPGLTERLIGEMSGIFNRIQAAYARLVARGKFVQPPSGEALKRRLRENSNPGPTWFEETFDATGDKADMVVQAHVIDRWRDHFSVKRESMSDLKVARAIQRLLPSTSESVRIGSGSTDGKFRVYTGLRWKVDPNDGELLEENQRVDWTTGEVVGVGEVVSLANRKAANVFGKADDSL